MWSGEPGAQGPASPYALGKSVNGTSSIWMRWRSCVMVSILRKNAEERRGKRSAPSARRPPIVGEPASSLFLMLASRGVMNSFARLMTLPRGRKHLDRNSTLLDLLLILGKDRVAKRGGCLIQGFRRLTSGLLPKIRHHPLLADENALGRAEHSSLGARLMLPPYNLRIRKYDGGSTLLVLPFAHECWLPQAGHVGIGVGSHSPTLERWPIFRFQNR